MILTFLMHICLNVTPLITKGFLNAILESVKNFVAILLDFSQVESFFHLLVS